MGWFPFWSSTYPTHSTVRGLPSQKSCKFLKSAFSWIRLLFSGEVDSLEGKVRATAEDRKLPRLGVHLHEDSKHLHKDTKHVHKDTKLLLDHVDTPLLMELANESILEANFEIR